MSHLPGDVEIKPTSAALGAEVRNLDGSAAVPAQVILELKRALREHHVLIFKDQDLSEEQFKAFASYFGSVFRNPPEVPVLASDGEGGVAPDVVRVSNIDGYTGTGDLSPHADHQWTPYPSSGSLLYALEVPAQGGDTSFYNLNQVYESLSAELKQRIAELQLITYNPFLIKQGDPRPRYRFEAKALTSPVFPHPLVRTHPDSGLKVLFLSEASEVEVVGLPPAEGSELVERLRAHLFQERFAYRHKWSPGDIVYWDNQATLHARTAFDPNARRVMKRISLAGSRPF